jgi:hypothetical protein
MLPIGQGAQSEIFFPQRWLPVPWMLILIGVALVVGLVFALVQTLVLAIT